MTAAAAGWLSWLWALAVAGAGWRHRPQPSRVYELLPAGEHRRRWASPVARLGAFLKAIAGVGPRAEGSCTGGSVPPAAGEHTPISGPQPPVSAPGVMIAGDLAGLAGQATGEDPVTDRRVGWTVIGAAFGWLVSPVGALAVVALSAGSVASTAARRRRQAEGRVVNSLPDAIDLFVLVAGAGHPVQRCVQLVAARAGGPVGEALRMAAQRVEHGLRTSDALERVVDALGEPVRPLVGVLCASERYGTPLVPALERLAVESRNDRRRCAEETARRVPVKMLFPLVLCTLPAFALLTVVPLLIGAFGSLRL